MARLAEIVLLWAAALAAQPDIVPARIGYIRDATNRLRPLFGVSANFILGEAEHSGVLSAACSGRFVLAKTEDTVMLLDEAGRLVERWTAPAGPALFAFAADGTPALAFFPGVSELMRVERGRLRPVALDFRALEGQPLTIALEAEGRVRAVLVGRNALRVRSIRLATGLVEEERELDGAAAPALALPDGTLVYSSSTGLVVRRPDGGEEPVGLPARALTLDQLSEDRVGVRLEGGGRFALRLHPGGHRLDRLPEATP